MRKGNTMTKTFDDAIKLERVAFKQLCIKNASDAQ